MFWIYSSFYVYSSKNSPSSVCIQLHVLSVTDTPNLLRLVCVGLLLLGMRTSLYCDWLSVVNWLKKPDLPSPRSKQILLMIQLEMRFPTYFSFSKLGSRLAWLIQALWHAVCHSCIKFVWAPALLCLENTVFLKSSTTSGSHNFIYFQVDLWAQE